MADAEIGIGVQPGLDDEGLLGVDIVSLGEQLEVTVEEGLFGGGQG
jgi:hypothetical protein